MIRRRPCFPCVVFLAVMNASVLASSGPVVVEVSEQAALFDQVVRDRASAIVDRMSPGNSALRVDELVAIDDSADLSPARIDAVFFDLVRRLRALDPDQVPSDVLAYLKARPVVAVRRHEESADYLVPLFDVAGAVRGLENQWDWSEGFDAIRVPGTLAVADMLQRYATDPDQPFARGLRAALPTASMIMLDKLAAASTDELLLDHFLPYLWLARQQIEELGNWLPVGPDRRVADVIRLASISLDANQFQTLGQAMLSHPDAGSRAMTLALLTDHHLARTDWPSDWANHLWTLVDDTEVQSAVALQLARLGAAEHWQANPASAPANALDSTSLERIRIIEKNLASTRGGVR